MARRRKNYKYYKQKHPLIQAMRCGSFRDSLLAAAVIVGAFVLLFVLYSPGLQPLRDSAAFTIFCKLVFSGLFLFFSFYPPKKVPVPAAVVVGLMALEPWIIPLFSSVRHIVLLDGLLLYALLGTALYLLIAKREHCTVLYVAFGWAFLAFLSDCDLYAFAVDPKGLHFWEPALAVALSVTIVCVNLLFWGAIRISQTHRVSEGLSLVALVLILTFSLCCCTLCNLNFALDSSPAEEYHLTVQSKEHAGVKTVSYELILQLDGQQLPMDVSDSEYYCVEVGDPVTVAYHSGWMNEPYYTITELP